MTQFQAEVPDPLRHQLPALLSPGRMAAPSIRIDFLVFIREYWLKRAAMQVQLDDIAGGKPLLRQGSEEQLVDDACARDAHRVLLLACGMGGDNHAAVYAIGSDRHLWTVVEAAHHLAFRALLKLIGWQVQAGLNEWMIEDAVLFATRHQRGARQIGEDGSSPILACQ